MDYCHHCRRHLNGALACAGCGTPAEELRLHDPVPYEAEVVLATREHGQESAPGPRRQRGSRKRKVTRRERREMRAERGAHRRKGRVVLLTVMGLVLAVGALSLAELALESGGDGDATSVQEDRAIELDGGPPPSDPKEPKDPGPVVGTPSGSTGSARPGGNGSPDPSATGTGKGSGPADEGSPAPSDSAGASDGPNPSDSPGPTDSTSPTGGPSTPGQPNQPPPPAPDPTPTPTPTEDDDCVLIVFCF
ncbi:hypothetical protein [Streptomyces sp. NP-1717]|uniref:SCO2400 family protein n=1 Tax=Streptomyces sp. NP-1717 TaxID=2704470 RepID=UPI001F5D8013|nr:hypothetical protein [Streptomyces sp. NP-1717]MCI3223260.1 hypothetical protein [Streptomyces sp. NP-1717]